MTTGTVAEALSVGTGDPEADNPEIGVPEVGAACRAPGAVAPEIAHDGMASAASARPRTTSPAHHPRLIDGHDTGDPEIGRISFTFSEAWLEREHNSVGS